MEELSLGSILFAANAIEQSLVVCVNRERMEAESASRTKDKGQRAKGKGQDGHVQLPPESPKVLSGLT